MLVAESAVNGEVLPVYGENLTVWRNLTHPYEASICEIHLRVVCEQAMNVLNLFLKRKVSYEIAVLHHPGDQFRRGHVGCFRQHGFTGEKRRRFRLE